MVRNLLLNAQRSQSVHGTEPALHAAASACVTMRLALRAPSGGNGCLTAAWRPGCVWSASSDHRGGMVSAAAPDMCLVLVKPPWQAKVTQAVAKIAHLVHGSFRTQPTLVLGSYETPLRTQRHHSS
jgi:hypothetical protein